LFFGPLLIESFTGTETVLEDESMEGFPSLVPSRRRSSCRTALLFGIALSILCVGIGCGDFTLFGDDDQGICDPDPCAGKDNATADTCTDLGGDDYTCDCESGYFWEDEGNTCEDPCDPDPCEDIQNAETDTCDGVGVDNFTCDCVSGYVWDGTNESCEDDPCDPDPCDEARNEVAGSCKAVGGDDYTCGCDPGFTWNAQNERCEAGAVGTCDDLKECLSECSGITDFVCSGNCYGTWTGCDCVLDTAVLIEECAGTCLIDCINIESKACWDCALECGFDTQCQ
jgi:hypothetical protein